MVSLDLQGFWEGNCDRNPHPAALLCPDHAVAGQLLWKTGLVGQRVVGKHGVVSRGAGAVGVLTGGRILLKGHRKVQVVLSEEDHRLRLMNLPKELSPLK